MFEMFYVYMRYLMFNIVNYSFHRNKPSPKAGLSPGSERKESRMSDSKRKSSSLYFIIGRCKKSIEEHIYSSPYRRFEKE